MKTNSKQWRLAGILALSCSLAFIYQNCSQTKPTLGSTSQSNSNSVIQSTGSVSGGLDSVSSVGLVSGWVSTGQNPSPATTLAVVLDNNPNSTINVNANVPQLDGSQGFQFQLPEAYLDGGSHTLSASISGAQAAVPVPGLLLTISTPNLPLINPSGCFERPTGTMNCPPGAAQVLEASGAYTGCLEDYGVMNCPTGTSADSTVPHAPGVIEVAPTVYCFFIAGTLDCPGGTPPAGTIMITQNTPGAQAVGNGGCFAYAGVMICPPGVSP